MVIRLFNTLSAKHEGFEPINRQRVLMYVCGPTVYNYIHIGNARPIVIFDTLFRLLKLIYPEVVYVRNITDIDDKIIQTAKDNSQTCNEVTETYSKAFHNDIARLNTLPPTVEPRATEHLPQMIDMVEQLIAKKFAYEASGNILFDVTAMPTYGQLSKRNVEDMIAGARVEVADYKKNPADFILWKPSSIDQPGWDSPWGRGRPGWHLECSAMAKVHLDRVIDIHGGGQDLIFPHHENEIAQSCCAYNQEIFARYWVHNGYITVNSEKMSKSLNNFFTLREVLERHDGEVIRYTLLNTHYRKPLNWTESKLTEAKTNLDKMYRSILDAKVNFDASGNIMDGKPDPAVMKALCDDLNTPQAIVRLHELRRDNQIRTLISSAHQLGLMHADPQAWFRRAPATQNTLGDASIEALIVQREEARNKRNYAQADQIREQLSTAGICLEDKAGQTQWRRK